MSNTHKEQQAIALRKEGMSIAKIMTATGLKERKVKDLIRSIPKVSPINTPLAKAVERVFQLAKMQHGIRDYELRDIMRNEYGSKWDTSTGKYVSSYSRDDIKYVREKVRIRAAQEDCNVLFTPDWIDETAPTAGREYLEAAAKNLMHRIESAALEYMELHATRWTEDSEEADLAQLKQRYAVERHLLKLAIRGYGGEPLAKLLERSLVLTDLLEGTPDAAMTSVNATTEKLDYYPEPKSIKPFLDFVESQGWLKEVEHRFI
ncbi:hypothetical protein [Pseudomonas petrae]|uniref:Uncharacterized protein n=1 Tax=Pseudomonas petrae TaxID=2912190 RepID=A0ABS9IDG2_9PSED|nr:hypothetical protein [Pseudomonas petrae]MCF7545695.1 hypothetical protein [Pseudomonas petrae]